METEDYDFNRICRTCKCESVQMLSIFDGLQQIEENTRIDEMLMACASIQVNTGDGLPSFICKKCTEQLRNAYIFKQQCEKVDKSLRERLKTDQIVKEESQLQQNDIELESNILYKDLNSLLNNQQSNNETVNNNSSNELPVVKQEPDQNLTDHTIKSDFVEFLENNQLILTCRDCLKVFTTLEGLRCHKRLHTGSMFKCKTCGKEYTRQNHLHRHELSHGRRKVHVCKICNKTLTRFEHLKRHLTIHLKEKPFSCQTCNRGFNRSEHLANHMKKCKGDPVYVCDICNKSFNREDSLEVHKRLHENKMPILPTLENLDNIEEHYYEIDYDGASVFSDTSDNDNDNDEVDDYLETHVGVLEENNEQEKPVETQANVVSTDVYVELNTQDVLQEKKEIQNDGYQSGSEEEGEMCNDVAGRDSDSNHSEYLPFKTNQKVKRGRGRPRKNNVVSKTTGRPRGRPRIKQEVEDENEEIGGYPCTVCNKIFEKISMLDKHSRKHAGIKLHKCSVCNKQFSRSNHLKRHMASHSEDKPYVCEICTKCFSRRDHLTQHIRLHAKLQEYECSTCKQTFSRPDHLAKHNASKHNIGEKVVGEKKFKCSVCMKGFTTEKYRDIHMRAHTGEKKFQCKTCDKAFISKSHLTEHMKFHNDNSKKYLCSECGQRFIRNDYLVIHMRRHRGEKPFKCKYCGKGFPRTTDLTVHERYHTGEKTHLCTICGRGFGRAYNLTVHMRTHTGEKPYQCTYCDAAFAQGNDLKAHIRRHTGERFQCELCTETFIMGYLLTQHKRTVHGLNVVSNIRRLQPVHKIEPTQGDQPPITIALPTPVVPSRVLKDQIRAQLEAKQLP